MNPVQIFYNHPYFENLELTNPFLEYLEREQQNIKKTIKGGKVLDIGCGNGRSTEILSEIADDVIGIDFSERLLEQAGKRLSGRTNVQLFYEDAKNTHFDDSSFDYVVMLWNTFGNLYNARDQVLSESKRILRLEGQLLMSVLSERVLPDYLQMLKQNGLVITQYDENYVFLREGLVSERFSREKLEKICRANGLTPGIEKLTDISYWCKVRK